MKIEDIKTLLKLVEKAKVAEFDYSSAEGDRLYINKNSPVQQGIIQQVAPAAVAPVAGAIVATAEESPEATSTVNENTLLSPLVGTFYGASGPDAAPFVTAGKTVKKGDIVCIVEAMKIMNQVRAEEDGTIDQVLVKDGQPVEYGQPLFSFK